jgi:hypothetical protein
MNPAAEARRTDSRDPPDLEEALLETLLDHPDLAPGFTSQQLEGQGQQITFMGAAEHVRGQAACCRVDLVIPRADADRLLDILRREFASPACSSGWCPPDQREAGVMNGLVVLSIALLSALMPTSALPATAPDLPPEAQVFRRLRSNPRSVPPTSTSKPRKPAHAAWAPAPTNGRWAWANRTDGFAVPPSRYTEWDVGLERTVRLPGKRDLDQQLGAAGIATARVGRGEALHRRAEACWPCGSTGCGKNPPSCSGAINGTT